MQAVREAVRIPVLANGNIRNLQDVHDCLAYTGAVGVMSAESLLEDPALFSEHRLTPEGVLKRIAVFACWASGLPVPYSATHTTACMYCS